jgi:hypothetical protein
MTIVSSVLVEPMLVAVDRSLVVADRSLVVAESSLVVVAEVPSLAAVVGPNLVVGEVEVGVVLRPMLLHNLGRI